MVKQPLQSPQFTDVNMKAAWIRLDCALPGVAECFTFCWPVVDQQLSQEERDAYLDIANFIGKMGSGSEPVIDFLSQWPDVYPYIGMDGLNSLRQFLDHFWCSANAKAISLLLQKLSLIAKASGSSERFRQWLNHCYDLAKQTTPKIHGQESLGPSQALLTLLEHSAELLQLANIVALENWISVGIRITNGHPELEKSYFSLQSSESQAVLLSRCDGDQFRVYEKGLQAYMKGFWQADQLLIPYSTLKTDAQDWLPYFDDEGIRLPDRIATHAKVRGLDQYRLMLGHMMMHQQYSRPRYADNLSPLQRITIEWFEDIRMDRLLMQRFPGLIPLFRRLHPTPTAHTSLPNQSDVMLRLCRLSRSLIDPNYLDDDTIIQQFTARFDQQFQLAALEDEQFIELALEFVTRTRQGKDQFAKVTFTETRVPWRDDNRHLWAYIELGDEEELFEQPQVDESTEPEHLPARVYSEWDYLIQSYRPDWCKVYEALAPSGSSQPINLMLDKNRALIKQIRQLAERLKPQNPQRLRYQEKGNELDTDELIRAWLDLKTANTPTDKIYFRHVHQGRSIALLLLLDLSHSLNDPLIDPLIDHASSSLLELSQEAVAILATAVDTLGDDMAVAGFNSNTREAVHYLHIKGFSEDWDDTIKGRLATTEARYSTRMGAALRHAGQYLAKQKTDKKLLWVLSDGKPSDIDIQDPDYLTQDAAKAVHELEASSIHSYCINLDPKADEYVSSIFGQKYCVIDDVKRLPQTLPKLFLSLTH